MTLYRALVTPLVVGAVGGALVFGLFSGSSALAGQPVDWQMGFQDPASPVMERIIDLHDMLLIISAAVLALVVALLLVVVVKFNSKANPVPSTTSHNTMLEMIWTIAPVFLLIAIAVPSFSLLYYSDKAPDAEMTIKAIGHQWYWTYEYPDDGNFEFDAYMVEDEDLAAGDPRLLATEEKIVLPVDTDIRLLVTADDVIHSWAIPALGVKIDAVPGRLSETWLRITREGKYYGQCSELCGVRHGFMPIEIHAVSKDAYEEWVGKSKEAYARKTPAVESPEVQPENAPHVLPEIKYASAGILAVRR